MIEEIIFFIVGLLIILFAPRIMNHELFIPYREFVENNPWVSPIFLIFVLVIWPLSIVYWEHRQSGVPFRIVAQSYWEYITAKNYAERRLSTLKLVLTEKELEENK